MASSDGEKEDPTVGRSATSGGLLGESATPTILSPAPMSTRISAYRGSRATILSGGAGITISRPRSSVTETGKPKAIRARPTTSAIAVPISVLLS